MATTTISVELLLYASLSLGVFFADLFETGFSALLVLFTFLLDTQALLFPLFVDSFSLFASALLVFLVALFTLLAPSLLLLLPCLLASFILFFLAAPALFLLRPFLTFPLALCLEFLLSPGFTLFSASFCFLSPFFFALAASLFLFGSRLGANFGNAVLAHFWHAMFVNQFVQQSVDCVHDIAVDVAAFTRTFYECSRHTWVFGQQGRVTVGFAVDELLEGSLKFIFSRLVRAS
jgi:hypothetical protein